MKCLECSIPMIHYQEDALLCTACEQAHPGLIDKARRDLLREMRQEAEEKTRQEQIANRRAAMRSSS